MPRLVRQLFVCLAVTLMVALQAYGVVSAQHRVEHSVEFPAAADAAFHAGDHGRSLEQSDRSDAEHPIGHHHHNGSDVQAALTVASHPRGTSLAGSANLGAASDTLPVGALRDAPYHPPRLRA